MKLHFPPGLSIAIVGAPTKINQHDGHENTEERPIAGLKYTHAFIRYSREKCMDSLQDMYIRSFKPQIKENHGPNKMFTKVVVGMDAMLYTLLIEGQMSCSVVC